MRKLKAVLILLLVLCLAVSLAPMALAGTLEQASGTCGDNLTWEWNYPVLTISGTGDMEDYSPTLLYGCLTTSAPWNYLLPCATTIIIEDGVTSIGNYAFYDPYYKCPCLTTVTLGDNIASIGDYAFAWCSELTEIEIPDGVISIGDRVFYVCSSLTSVTIPDSVTAIGERAFSSSGLTSVTIPNSITSIGVGVFGGCGDLANVTIPNSVISIGDSAFSTCSSLTSVAISNAVTAIGDDAFLGCSSLISVTIPDSVMSIGSDAFYECSSLASVTLPDNVTSIGGGVFCGCSSLTSVTISDSVAYIGSYTFYRCNALTDVYYGGDEASWNAITIADGNEPLAAAAIHYNSAANETGFADVAVSDYFYAPVVWAVEQGVTTGTSATTFSPSDACTRGQIITFLWRAAGSPAPTGSGAFSDVDADEYYADAAQWASEQGLDLSDGTFRPADPCTRATVVEYLYRLAGSPAVTAAADFADISAADAVAWAVEQGVTTGTSATTFSPSDTCTRGQIVTFLYRALA